MRYWVIKLWRQGDGYMQAHEGGLLSPYSSGSRKLAYTFSARDLAVEVISAYRISGRPVAVGHPAGDQDRSVAAPVEERLQLKVRINSLEKELEESNAKSEYRWSELCKRADESETLLETERKAQRIQERLDVTKESHRAAEEELQKQEQRALAAEAMELAAIAQRDASRVRAEKAETDAEDQRQRAEALRAEVRERDERIEALEKERVELNRIWRVGAELLRQQRDRAEQLEAVEEALKKEAEALTLRLIATEASVVEWGERAEKAEMAAWDASERADRAEKQARLFQKNTIAAQEREARAETAVWNIALEEVQAQIEASHENQIAVIKAMRRK